MAELPKTAREMVLSLPGRLREDKLDDDILHRFHLILDGPTGGSFTVTLKDKKVVVVEGLTDEPTCEIRAKATDFEDLETGKANPAMMFMMGKIKVSNIGEVMKFIQYFDTIHS